MSGMTKILLDKMSDAKNTLSNIKELMQASLA